MIHPLIYDAKDLSNQTVNLTVNLKILPKLHCVERIDQGAVINRVDLSPMSFDTEVENVPYTPLIAARYLDPLFSHRI